MLFFSQDDTGVEQLTLAPLVASQGVLALLAVEQEEPDFVMLCDDLPNLGIWGCDQGDSSEMRIVKAYMDMPCNLMVMMARVVAIMRRMGLAKRRSGRA